MLHLIKILAPVAHHDRSEELRIAADIVVIAGIERLAVPLVPEFLWPEVAALEDRALVAVLRPVLDMPARLKNEDIGARRSKRGSDGRPADPRADDDDVLLLHQAILPERKPLAQRGIHQPVRAPICMLSVLVSV